MDEPASLTNHYDSSISWTSNNINLTISDYNYINLLEKYINKWQD